MIQLSELIGHDTLDVSTAMSLGALSGVGLVGDRIVSLGIDGVCLDAAAVRGFDGDVVSYDPDAGMLSQQSPEPRDPRGSMVLDLHGDRLGTLADLAITADGIVDTIQLEGGHALRGARLRVIGSYAAIVDVEETTPPDMANVPPSPRSASVGTRADPGR